MLCVLKKSPQQDSSFEQPNYMFKAMGKIFLTNLHLSGPMSGIPVNIFVFRNK